MHAGWYRIAAQKGNAAAQHNLSFCYSEGEGVPRDDTVWDLFGKMGGQGLKLGKSAWLRAKWSVADGCSDQR